MTGITLKATVFVFSFGLIVSGIFPDVSPVYAAASKTKAATEKSIKSALLGQGASGSNKTASYTVGWQRPAYRGAAFIDTGFDASPTQTAAAGTARRSVSTGMGPIDPTALGVLSADTGGVTSYKSKTAASVLSLSGVPPSGLASPAPSGYTTTTGSATSPNALTAAPIPSGYNSTLTLSGDSTVTVTVEPTIALAAAQPDPAALGNSAPKTTALMSSGGATTQNYGTLSDNIPWNAYAYIATDFSNVRQICNTSSQNNSYIKNIMDGQVKWGNGEQVPAGYAVVFYDPSDRQVVGWFDITEWGLYDLRNSGYGMFAEVEDQSGDQGWENETSIAALIRSPDGNTFWDTSWAGTVPSFSWTQEYIGTFDINGGGVVFVPEPSTYLLMILGGAGLAGWRRVRGKKHVGSNGFKNAA
jgi:hypothetical protein